MKRLKFIAVKRDTGTGQPDTASLRIEPTYMQVVGVLPHGCFISFDPHARKELRRWLDRLDAIEGVK